MGIRHESDDEKNGKSEAAYGMYDEKGTRVVRYSPGHSSTTGIMKERSRDEGRRYAKGVRA